MSKGSGNPITVHSIEDEVFAIVWSFIAEAMIPEGEISRYTRESIANLVSTMNECPMCVTAHAMMSSAAKLAQQSESLGKSDEEKAFELARHQQAFEYAEYLIGVQHNNQKERCTA